MSVAEIRPDNQQKVAAVYARVSTADQRDRGFSLPTQRDQCLALAESLGYTVPETYVFEEDYTGTSLRRPQLGLLRDLVQQRSIQAIVIYDSDRLSRKLAHQLLLEDEFAHAGVALHVVMMPNPDKSPEGQLMSQIKGAIAEFERAKILERTRRGREGRAKAGHVPPGGRTFGYTHVKDAVGAHYEPHPEEAPIVQRIFHMYVHDGLSQEAIAEKLTAEGIPPPKAPRKLAACTWRQSTVKFLLRNESYIGVMYDNKRKNVYVETEEGRRVRYERRPRAEWVPVQVPAIIDMATWDRAQTLRATNKSQARCNRKYTYLLAGGRLRCGVCGYAMSPHMSQDRQARYRCAHSTRHYAIYHHVKSVRADLVELEVWAQIERILSNPTLLARELAKQQERFRSQQERLDQEREGYRRELQRIEHESAKLWEAYTNDAITVLTFKSRNTDLETRKQKIEVELVAMGATDKALQESGITLEMLRDYCAHVDNQLQDMSVEKKVLAAKAFGIQAVWTPGQPLEITGEIDPCYNGGSVCYTPEHGGTLAPIHSAIP